ncbi:hypothetical protein [Paraferrimonas sedimenticola]|uniref:Uncharacterized protein n=1 Tax=Paraferrimonas sedimenticola TaxID=375674 RepID=A0AA37RXD0_9GAMM|nr:hypothetical protein [Paraferrimonas sedimenticola]GLP96674.1 hypothetical protein GCM10007895_19800 [Paraferrimonas sedimenticola]
MEYLPHLQALLLLGGVLLVITALVKYIARTKNYNAVWQVFVNKLNDMAIGEFKLFRMGVLFLFIGILVRIANLIIFGP